MIIRKISYLRKYKHGITEYFDYDGKVEKKFIYEKGILKEIISYNFSKEMIWKKIYENYKLKYSEFLDFNNILLYRETYNVKNGEVEKSETFQNNRIFEFL